VVSQDRRDAAQRGFVPPKSFTVDLRPRGGVAATGGTHITANSNWLAGQIHKEATGAIVHEEVHVVQQYSNFAGGGVNGRRGATQPTAATRPATRPAGATTQARRGRRGGPNDTGWLTEGIADYIRWWYYEPDGPRRYPALTAQTSYAGSSTVTANFLHYVAEKYDKDLVKKMNAALREHRYTTGLWSQYTGKDLEALNTEWKKTLKPSTRPATRPARRQGAE